MLRWLALSLVLLLAACGGMKVEEFEGRRPRLVLEEYFAGRSTAHGIFVDRFGTLKREFVVDIRGDWRPDTATLTLTEDFRYSDGETEQRVWTIRKTGPQTYEGVAGGVVGIALGRGAGNAFNWVYTFDLKVGDGTWRVAFDDWFWLQEGNVLMNRATISKFGLELGVVSIAFVKN